MVRGHDWILRGNRHRSIYTRELLKITRSCVSSYKARVLWIYSWILYHRAFVLWILELDLAIHQSLNRPEHILADRVQHLVPSDDEWESATFGRRSLSWQ